MTGNSTPTYWETRPRRSSGLSCASADSCATACSRWPPPPVRGRRCEPRRVEDVVRAFPAALAPYDIGSLDTLTTPERRWVDSRGPIAAWATYLIDARMTSASEDGLEFLRLHRRSQRRLTMTTSEAELRAEVRRIERQRLWIVVLGVLAVLLLGVATLRAPVQGWLPVLIVVSVSLGTAGRNYRSLGRRRVELRDHPAGEGPEG